MDSKLLVAREGIEPPTRGFSARCRVFEGFNNQSLTALATPLPQHTKAQSWHSQSELVTFLARDKRSSYSGQWRSPLTGDEGIRAAERLSLSLLASPPPKSPAQRVSCLVALTPLLCLSANPASAQFPQPDGGNLERGTLPAHWYSQDPRCMEIPQWHTF